MSNNAEPSAKTYRKAVNMLSDALGIEPTHTKYPKEDFEDLVDIAHEMTDPEAIKRRMVRWYRLGIRRGYIRACDAIIHPDGELSLQGGTLYCNSESVKIRVRLKMDGKWHKRTFEFSGEDLEFED